MPGFTPIPFTNVKITDPFFLPKIETVCNTTVEACLAKCEETGRIANFAKAAGLAEGEFEGIFYNDSDVYKVLEGVAYILEHTKNEALEARADEIIRLIAAAQEPDGYILTYFTLVKPDEKWTDMSKHEDYCVGHLIEAGLAYYQATGKSALLDVGRRAADHMAARFGPGKMHWVTGHQEAELALFKLYEHTGDAKYKDLACFLLEERGRGYGKGSEWDDPNYGAVHVQDHVPVADLRDAAGHAVRLMYMLSAVTDAARLTGNAAYLETVDRLWDSVVNRNMYLTGGVGSSRQNEGFTEDYDLPNLTAYCETCASVGMVYWNHRMNMLLGDARYADIVETELYNGALAGLSLSGDRFFYDNPLESEGKFHRSEWFGTSCCPTQLVRFVPSIGGYVCAAGDDGIVVNQYIGCEAKIPFGGGEVALSIEGAYPFGGYVRINLETDTPAKFALRLRKPVWCGSLSVCIGSEEVPVVPVFDRGYLVIEREWDKRTLIRLKFDMPVTVVKAAPRVAEDAGKAALRKGPVIYCFEEADNNDFDRIALSGKSVFISAFDENLLGGADVLTVLDGGREFRAVPYFAWDNRAPGRMKVWVESDNIDLFQNLAEILP
ncbi:MAG: glycoside hydrolase family 127 protein [Defluviitaleaceae bacterium]|nr:glycoside hydrolase family 127 protein [Defluviitaleaceae bacterium]